MCGCKLEIDGVALKDRGEENVPMGRVASSVSGHLLYMEEVARGENTYGT